MAAHDLWYKNAILYCLDVEKYMDANGDGTGDFEGLHRRLEYLAGLGVTCLWLQPFYPSPNRDNGYDITDFYGVHPKHGTPGDFVEFINHAKALGLRVIIDFVVSHTSDAHPWFQSACADPRSPFRDWYVWADERPKDYDKGMVFPGTQKSTWTFNDTAGRWYFHRFYDHQPDLDTHNPTVRHEIAKIMGYWLELGIAGFRMDAAPFIIAKKGTAIPTELDLGRLSADQRAAVFKEFAPDKSMQLYDRGIRRRLAPMLKNDRRRLELAFSLLFSLPGTPMMQYGDEIGMGDDLTMEERECARSPMQWTNEPHAGFSKAERTVRPVISDEIYGYEKVNVAQQRR